MKPCNCGKIWGQPYTADQCRLCWLYAYDDRYRRIWDSKGGPPPMPSIPQRILNFITAKAKWVAAGSPVVDDEVYAQRRRTCQQCPKRNPQHDACSLCGCPVSGQGALGDKLRMATSECPDNPPQWKAIV